jgi:hypothetical protein
MQTTNNQVQFSWHALERVATNGRYAKYVSYAAVQSVLQQKPLRNGTQKVPVATLGRVVRVQDDQARNGQYIEGSVIKAVVQVANGCEVNVITIVLE